MKIRNIRICGLKAPLGLDERTPDISWELASERSDFIKENIRQQFFEIIVYKGKQPIWKSGRRGSEAQRCTLQGIRLEPCCCYQVIVKVTITGGISTEGTTNWETGFLGIKGWEGKWIGPDRRMRQNVDMGAAFSTINPEESGEAPGDSVKDLYPIVRFDHSLMLKGKNMIRARIYVTARGLYEVQIDGKKVGDMELTPEFSAYGHYLQYQSFDVTGMLSTGGETVSVYLSDGYYIGRIGMIGLGYDYGEHISFLLQMEIEYEDGTIQKIISDDTWRYAETHILYSDIFIGEKQDLTALEKKADCVPKVFEDDKSVLIGQSAEPVKVLDILPAKEILTTSKGETVIDFGQTICGRAEICLNGKLGEEITLEHQEILDEAGNFYFNIPRFNCEQTDIFILRDGKQTIRPRFTYHGFRYVRVSGCSQGIKKEDCKAYVLGSGCEKTLEFECSDNRLNQLQHNIWWSQKSNFVSIPMDCPQRERAGWTGDIQIYSETAGCNAYVLPFLKRWLTQVRLEQQEDGEIPIVIPYSKGYQNMQRQFDGHTSAGWGDAGIIVPWKLYCAYGDESVLLENFDMMEKWLAYVQEQAKVIPDDAGILSEQEKEYQKYLWNSGFHYGDWLYPSAKNEEGISDAFLSAITTKNLVAPIMYAYSVQTMVKVCNALGKQKRASFYEKLNRKIKEAFAAVYVQEDGTILPELQGIYVLALRMDLIPEKSKEHAVFRLAELINENNGCLDTGFLSVPFLLDVLYDNGQKELAYKLLFNEKCPSWLYEVKKGATTMWENWDAVTEDGKPNVTSYNHYAFGCVGSWIYRRILGIQSTSPGYKTFCIQPDFDCGLEYARGRYHCVYGDISVSWNKCAAGIEIDIEVPVNTDAEIKLEYHNHEIHTGVGCGEYHYRLS